MPELPEVETMCRGIAPVVGRRVRAIYFPKSHLCPLPMSPGERSFRRRVKGRTILGVRRVAKRVVIQLDSEDAIVFEPRMTGRVLLAAPPEVKHVRAVIDFSEPAPGLLVFWSMRGLSTLHLFSPEEVAELLGPHRIGPDALAVTEAELRAAFGKRRGAIKPTLLDQKGVAGIGNIYASEILHRAKVHPEIPCERIRADQWRRIHTEMHAVLQAAVVAQGSTLDDGGYKTAEGRSGQYQEQIRVYGRTGETCQICGRGRIRRIVQAQRSTFFCLVCQRAGRR
jgi:formamidopyrimidine-DNA glycosylase